MNDDSAILTKAEERLLEAYNITPQTRLRFVLKPPVTFLLLSLFTFGLYNIYWFYMNWAAVREASHVKLSPFWRTLFNIFWIWTLFRLVHATAVQKGRRPEYSPVLLAATYAAVGIVGYPINSARHNDLSIMLVDILLALASIAPLIAIQQTMLLAASQKGRPKAAYEPATKVERVLIGCGMVFFALGIYGLLVGPPPQ